MKPIVGMPLKVHKIEPACRGLSVILDSIYEPVAQEVCNEDAEFIVHACNMHQKLIDQLKECLGKLREGGGKFTQVAHNTRLLLLEEAEGDDGK